VHVLAIVLVKLLVELAIAREGQWQGSWQGPREGPRDGSGAAAAHAALMLAVGEPVVGLAAGDNVVVAVTDLGDVLLLDRQGTVRRRLPIQAGHPTSRGLAPARRNGKGSGSATAARDGFLIGAGVPADDDFNDPYDVDSEVEDPTNVLLEDRPSGRRTDRVISASGGRAVLVAAGGRTAWFVRADGLVRASLDSDAPPERIGGSSAERWSALAASADGHWLAGVRGAWLVRSGDGGETFDPISPIAGPAERLALTKGGDVLLVDREGARRVGAAMVSSGSAWPEALDVCASGRGTIVLAAGGLAMVDSAEDSGGARASAAHSEAGLPRGGDSERTTTKQVVLPEQVDRLACDGGGETVAIGGASLWTSPDAGRTWSRRSELPPVAAAALAVTTDAAWIATPDGLWRVPVGGPVETSQERSGPASTTRPSGDELHFREPEAGATPARPARPEVAFIDLSLESRRPTWWAGALPRIDLAFTWATATGRRDVRALVFLSFAIDRDTGRALVHRGLMRQVLRRRSELASAALALSAADPAGSDAIDADERAALARILEAVP